MVFLSQAFNLGLLFENLTNEELVKLFNRAFSISLNGENLINSKIDNFNQGHSNSEELSGSFSFERDTIIEELYQVCVKLRSQLR